MEFSINVLELQRIIKLLGVVAKTNATDFTGRVFIETVDNGIEFLVNNGSTSLLYTSADAKIDKPGSTSVTYHKIKSFIASFKPWNGTHGAKDFYFKADGNNIKVNVSTLHENEKLVKANIKLTGYTNIVQKPDVYKKTDFVLNSTIFKTAINKVIYAINPVNNFGMGAIEGMNVNFDDENIYFAGTDGRVISEYKINNTSGYTGKGIILKYDFIMALRRIFGDDTQLFFEITKSRVNVKFDNMIFGGKPIIGHSYPDYKPTFEQYTNHLNINRKILLDSLSPFSDILDPDDNHRITFEIKDKHIRLFNDQAVVDFEQDVSEDLEFSVDVNGGLLMQTIDSIKCDTILLKFSIDKESSALILDSSESQDQKALVSTLRRR
jgi:DNA polymerase III sliding clamp (beta) subunit (PCNA family)